MILGCKYHRGKVSWNINDIYDEQYDIWVCLKMWYTSKVATQRDKQKKTENTHAYDDNTILNRAGEAGHKPYPIVSAILTMHHIYEYSYIYI